MEPLSLSVRLYKVGAGLEENSVLRQDLYAKPAPTLETSTKPDLNQKLFRRDSSAETVFGFSKFSFLTKFDH